MIEIALVLMALAGVGLVGFLAESLTPALMTLVGFGVLVLGLAVGLPAGFGYHVILYRFVSTKVPVSRTWWLSPFRLHRHLTDAEQRRIEPWYRIGGVGFVLSVAGGLAAIAGLLARS